MSQNEGSQPVHPLLVGEPAYINSWKEWKEIWAKTSLAEFRHSLLHFGFSVREASNEEWVERICFYLEVADGHIKGRGERDKLERPGEDKYSFQTPLAKEKVTHVRARQIIARKAFTMLTQNLFKDVNERSSCQYPSWARDVLMPGVLEKVLWFFRPFYPWSDGSSLVSNIERQYKEQGDVHTQIATKFLLDLCGFAWRSNYLDGFSEEENQKIQERFRNARPQFVEVLCGLGKSDFLLRNQRIFDEQCMAKLEKIAMKEELWSPVLSRYSKPKTLEEAVCGGSEAAQVLTLLRIKMKEQERLNEIRNLKLKRQDAESKLKELTRPAQ